jgi:hypothetical protein
MCKQIKKEQIFYRNLKIDQFLSKCQIQFKNFFILPFLKVENKGYSTIIINFLAKHENRSIFPKLSY